MKLQKWIILISLLLLTVTLSACGGAKNSTGKDGGSNVKASENASPSTGIKEDEEATKQRVISSNLKLIDFALETYMTAKGLKSVEDYSPNEKGPDYLIGEYLAVWPAGPGEVLYGIAGSKAISTGTP